MIHDFILDLLYFNGICLGIIQLNNYLLNIAFSCQSLFLLLLVRLVAQLRRISAFTLKNQSKYYPSLFLWLIMVHESRHERPISTQFYTSLRLLFGNTPSDGCGKWMDVGTVFLGVGCCIWPQLHFQFSKYFLHVIHLCSTGENFNETKRHLSLMVIMFCT